MKTYICPNCSEVLTEDEAESVCDCGCPSCRHFFDVADFEVEEEKEDPQKLHDGLFGNE